MPCTYFTDYELRQQDREAYDSVAKELNLATRLLCAVNGSSSGDALRKQFPELAAWWTAHQERDAARQKEESERARRDADFKKQARERERARDEAELKRLELKLKGDKP